MHFYIPITLLVFFASALGSLLTIGIVLMMMKMDKNDESNP
jgi:hypothetical protein